MTTEETGPAKSGRKRSPLFVILFTLFLDLVGFSIIFPLFPGMLTFYLADEQSASLLGNLLDVLHRISGTEPVNGAPSAQVIALFGGVLGSLYSLLQFLCAPFWGRVSDRTGRRPVLLFTIGGIGFSYVLWFFSGSFLLLVISRTLGGIMSGNIATATAAIADATTSQNRAKGMGMVGAAFGLGFIFGPVIGGVFGGIDLSATFPGLAAWGVNPYSAAAGVAFVLSVLNLVWVNRAFAETLSEEQRSKSHSSTRSINPARLLSHGDLPGVNRSNITNFLFIFSFSGMEFSLTFLAVDRFQYTPLGNAALLSFAGIVMVIIQGGLIRRLAPRFGEIRLASGGLGIIIPGLLLTGYAQSQTMLYGGVFLMAVGAAIVFPSLRSLVSRYTPADRQGEVLGSLTSLGALARASGPIVVGMVYWRYSATAAYCTGAAILLLPLFLTFALPKPIDQES